MKISITGIKLIEGYESLRLEAYKCPAGVWTIGLGTTQIDGVPVKKGQTCTEEQAYEYFELHMQKEVYPYLNKVKVQLNQNQIDALCSFIYNIGGPQFLSSTLFKLLNSGKFIEASEQFRLWSKAGGKVLKGLVKRRKSEKELFLKP
jgi:lysozyme